MTGQDAATVILEIQQAADLIAQEVETYAPGVAVPTELAQTLFDLAAKAVAAWLAASGIDPTPENLALLLPNPEPLSPPTV